MPVIQANVTKGHKRDKKTVRWLMGASFKFPVQIIEQSKCELFHKGRSLVKWNEGDFIRFDYLNNEIIGATVIPADEALETDEDREAWRRRTLETIEVTETDPEYRANQLRTVERVT